MVDTTATMGATTVGGFEDASISFTYEI